VFHLPHLPEIGQRHPADTYRLPDSPSLRPPGTGIDSRFKIFLIRLPAPSTVRLAAARRSTRPAVGLTVGCAVAQNTPICAAAGQ
jgi:hypothetical protein